ncbi:hypothetical protein IF650_09950 [Cellulosimicrobium terreum]|nr:hypothetical protein [Cellulosimicrobium terreum]
MSVDIPAGPPVGPPTGLAFYDHVRAYAAQVRAHLADLPPELADDLTDGLVADLAEAVVDAPGALPRRRSDADADAGPDDGSDVEPTLDLAVLFGPAAEYAAELRAAAGLAPQQPTPSVDPRRGLRAGLEGLRARGAARWRTLWAPVTSTEQWAHLREFFRSLTPAWWVLRGWVVATMLLLVLGGYQISALPPDTSARLLVLALVVVSVQWGRGRWLPLDWMPRGVRYVSVGAAVLAIPLVLAVSPTSGSGFDAGYEQGYYAGSGSTGGQVVSYGDGYGGPGGDGVWVDGMQVSNLFVYDAAGEPVRDVQVFDDRGRPVRTVTEDGAYSTWTVPDVEGSWYFQPVLSTDGRERWNVYPLRAVDETDVEYPDDSDGRPVPATGAPTVTMPWPFLQAPTAIPSDPEGGATVPEDGGEPDGPASPAPSGTTGPTPVTGPDPVVEAGS